MIDKKKVIELAEERIKELEPGLYLVDISIGADNRISVELDREEGAVSIDDCVSVSRNIEHNLDREAEDFSLEVASAGLSQPFKVQKQYLKNVGKEVSVLTADQHNKIEGVLKSATDDGIVVETKSKEKVEGKKKKEWVVRETTLKYNEIKETKLIISF